MIVDDVMTKEVLTVSRDMPLRDVAQLLVDHSISGLPVMEDGEVVGVVSGADIFELRPWEIAGRFSATTGSAA